MKFANTIDTKKKHVFLCHKSVLDKCLTILSGITTNILLFDQTCSDLSDKIGMPEFVLHDNDDIVNFENYCVRKQKGKLCLSSFNSSYKYNQYYGILYEINDFKFTRKDIVLESLIEKATKSYYVSGYYQTKESLSFIKLSKCISNDIFNISPCAKEAVIVRGGYGDIIMQIPILQTFINQKKQQEINVHIITSLSEKVDMLKRYLYGCEVRYFNILPDNYYYLNQIMLMSGEYQNCYYISPVIPPIEKPYHITELWAKILNVTNIIDSYREFKKREFPISDMYILEKINHAKKSYKVLIGVHFHTSHDEERSWPEQYARDFLHLCHQNGIGVVNLGPNTFEYDDFVIDLENIPVADMFGIVKVLNTVVGIDSCFGHMAGVLGIPNITIWGKGYPHRAEMRPVSYRSVSNNFSLAAKDMNIRHITPNIVYKELCNVLSGQILLKDSYITIEDSLAGLGVRWIESGEKK